MARGVTIKLNHRGIRELLRSRATLAVVEKAAQQIADRAGPGMEGSAVVGRTRVVGGVITATTEARVAEARHRALTRAIDAGGDL